MRAINHVMGAFGLGCALVLAGCGSGGLPAKAIVTTIDRKCAIITSTTRQVDSPYAAEVKIEAQELDSHRGECKSVAEWDEVRTKRTKKVDGTAVVHVEYVTPHDGQVHRSSLKFDGRDDEFYTLRAGDGIDIVISNSDPDSIRKA